MADVAVINESVNYAPEMEIDIPKCCVHYIISTGIQDYEEDIMMPGAFDLAEHNLNPLAVLDHDLDIPVGTWANTKDEKFNLENIKDFYSVKYISSDVLGGSLYFNQSDCNAMAVFDLIVKGIYIGVSPGFITKSFKANPKAKQQNSRHGRLIERAVLKEAGPCALGENPEALAIWVEKSYKKHYAQLNPKILTQLKSFIPERTTHMASMITDKKKLTTAEGGSTAKPEDTGVPDKPAKTATDEAGQTQLKGGHKALNAVHSAAMAYKAMMEEHGSVENTNVTDFIGDLNDTMDDIMDRAITINGSDYPDHPELKAMEKADHYVDSKHYKHAEAIKSLEKELKKTFDTIKRQDIQIKSLTEKLEGKKVRSR